MGYKVDNAVVLAAGTSSRFAPISYERPKGLIEVRGEILLERQIRQLQAANIPEIIVVVGYMKEKFEYLRNQFGVTLVENPDYLTRNNNASIQAVREYLGNTYICSCDNYFSENPFESEVDEAYYAGVYAVGETAEWCMTEDAEGYIQSVSVGGKNAWYMLGHAFWSREFSRKFLEILDSVYDLPETANALWERIYVDHLGSLRMKLRKYPREVIYEFDTLDELREFDTSYRENTRSGILKSVAKTLGIRESEITNVTAYYTEDNAAAGFRFRAKGAGYQYYYQTGKLQKEEKT